jgi:hypothetical protein
MSILVNLRGPGLYIYHKKIERWPKKEIDLLMQKFFLIENII